MVLVNLDQKILKIKKNMMPSYLLKEIEFLNNKSHGLLPPVGFLFLSFDQAVPYHSQCHLADWNAIYILHQ